MPKVLIVDDDAMMREFLRRGLRDSYEVIGTSDPAEALALTLEHKPDAILLDLNMPTFSGFELCQTLHSLSYTSEIPIFVVSGEQSAKHKTDCEKLGAKGYFEKPVNFTELKLGLDAEIHRKKPERRSDVRVRMRVPLKLKGRNLNGEQFEECAETENVSARGFLCLCRAPLWEGATVEVFLPGEQERYAGLAEVVRQESSGERWHRYGFRFKDVTTEWVLQGSQPARAQILPQPA